MIGKLQGKIEHVFEDHCMITVSGVSYSLYCTEQLLQKLHIGEETSLFTHTMLRDDIPVLYGFKEYKEKKLFILLTAIQGVGGRMGLALLGEIDYTTLVSAVQQENPKILQLVSGVGAKIALRIINELKSNKKFFADQMTAQTVGEDNHIKNDAISALTNLGFRRNDVITVVGEYFKESASNNLEEIIKNCIAKLKR